MPELSHFVPVTSPRNLDDNLNHARDEGEKIDLLIHTALNPHAPALIGLGEFLNSRDLTILAATLRGLASIGETLKQQNLDPNYRHHLEQLKYVLTANLDLHDDENPSVHLFKRLCHDAESGGSEMVRWAAAYALHELDYPFSLRRQLLTQSPAEILAEIWTKYKSRLSEQNRKSDPTKVAEDLRFGVYGHTERLFAESSSEYSFDIVCQVLRKTGIRGIRLALKCGNISVVVEAINFAGELFNQIDPNSQDKRYKDNATRQKLANLLLPFLNQSDLEIRNLIAENLNDKRNQHDVSNRLIDQNNRAKVAVIDTDWKRAISLGDLAIPILCEAVEGKLLIEKAENLNVNCQIEAVRSIDKSLTDVSRKVSTLAPHLQHDNHSLRMTVASLLEPHRNRLDAKSSQITIALFFKLNLPQESNISLSNPQLDKSTVERYVKLAGTSEQSIQDIFKDAITACEVKSISTKDFLAQQQRAFLDRIANYLDDLDDWLQDYDDDLEEKTKQKEEELKRQTLCSELSREYVFLQQQVEILNTEIKENNSEMEHLSKRMESLTRTIENSGIPDYIFERLLFFLIYIPIFIGLVSGLLWGVIGYVLINLMKVMTREAFDPIF
ncbi:MAG: hypothetical protein IM539_06420 [Pseudanabaena sp. M046S1SP1A06QC]|nr:hypothetical protein [Pseudanabaena sp. M046S1SP1A06QC]